MKGGLLLNVVVAEGTAILELLASEDETLLVWRNSFLVLDLGLHVLDSVAGLDLESNGLACESFNEDLHTSAKAKNQVKGRLLLNVVVAESTAILELLASEDETLLVWRNSFLVLNLGLHILDGVAGLDLERNGLACESFDEDLHTSAKAKNQVEGRLLLNVVVAESTAILELLASEDETLLVWRNSFLVLNLGLHVLDRVAGLDLESNGLACESFNEDLHTSAKAKNQVKGRLLLNVVVAEGTAILELLASEDETLLVWRDPLLVLNLRLHILDSVTGLNLKGDGLASQSFHEDLHDDRGRRHKGNFGKKKS